MLAHEEVAVRRTSGRFRLRGRAAVMGALACLVAGLALAVVAPSASGAPGTLVPVYGLNSILGSVPLLGDILISKKGEGIFGLTYAMKGNLNEPALTVNPSFVSSRRDIGKKKPRRSSHSVF